MELNQRLDTFLLKDPQISPKAWVAPSAEIYGDVYISESVSIWPGVVMRGDINSIHIGPRTNIQDGAIIHLADDFGVHIGESVTVGHGAIIHACHIEDFCLIGMSATILDGARIGKYSIVGAGAVVPKGLDVPEGSLVLGVPAKIKRPVTDSERNHIEHSAQKYQHVAEHYAKNAKLFA